MHWIGRLIVVVLVLSTLTVDASTFHDRLRKTPEKDSKALLELGEWCQEQGRNAWAAVCYKRVIDLGETAEYAEAVFQLCRIDLQRGRHEDAYRRLRELLATRSHPGAAALLEEAESNTTRKQRSMLAEAAGLADEGKFRKALKVYEKAYDLIPKDTAGADFVPRSEVLQLIASCRDRFDENQFQEKIQPVKHHIEPCMTCRSQGGFVQCHKCHGKGQVKIKKRKGRRIVWVWVTCGTCSGYKWLVCQQCGGFCYTTGAFNKKEKSAVIKTVKKSKDLKTMQLPLKKAIKEMEELILGLDESAALNFMRAIPPTYSLSRVIRKDLGEVPPIDGVHEYATKRWQMAKSDPRVRSSFLSSYASEYAQFVAQYDMLRPKRLFNDFRELPSAEAPAMEPLRPELLAAFPGIGKKNWVAVRGVYREFIDATKTQRVLDEEEEDEDDEGEDDDSPIADFADDSKGMLRIEGDVPHSVHFFVWLPSAQPYLQRLGKGRWKSRVGRLAKVYPFDLRDRIEALEKDHEVVLVGRLLRDPFGYPRNWFEVWDVQVGLDENQSRIYPALTEPIEISVDGVPVTEVLELVRWFGVESELARVKGARLVKVDALDCPVGVLIDELAKVLDVQWKVTEKGVRFVPTKEQPGGPGALVARLDGIGRGTCEVTTSVGKVTGGPGAGATDLPDALPELEKAATTAFGRMDYRRAADCYARIVTRVQGKPRWADAVRDRCRAALYDALTSATPASRLLEGGDLARIVVRTRSGATFERTVRIIDRQGGHIWIQPSYGGTVRLETTAIRNETAIDAATWKQEKKAELDRLTAEARSATMSRDRANKLFVLALHAKTHGFVDRGTAFLDQALKEPQFPWIIETYFAGRRNEMLRNWRGATMGSGIQPAPVAEPEPEEEVADAPVAKDLPEGTEALLEYATRHYRSAKKLLKKALPGMEGADEIRREAVEHLNAALDALDHIFKDDPEHAEGRRLQDDVTFLHHVCVKQLGMFD